MARQLTLRSNKPSTNSGVGGGSKFNFDPVEDNSVFEARVVGIEERDSRWDDEYNPGQKKRELNFKFEVDDPKFPDQQGRWFWGNTSTYFSDSPSNKLRQWVSAIEDIDVLPEGYVVDLDEIEARKPRVRIIVAAKEKADGSGIWNGVKELRPTKLSGAQAASVPNVDDPF